MPFGKNRGKRQGGTEIRTLPSAFREELTVGQQAGRYASLENTISRLTVKKFQ